MDELTLEQRWVRAAVNLRLIAPSMSDYDRREITRIFNKEYAAATQGAVNSSTVFVLHDPESRVRLWERYIKRKETEHDSRK